LAAVPPEATWFPPRPIIKKNKDAIKFEVALSKKPKSNIIEFPKKLID
jgi:hypothetical protein